MTRLPVLAVPLLLLAAAAPAPPRGIYTPAPGSAERRAIVATLHGADDRPAARFTFRSVRLFHKGPRAIAYVRGTGAVGDFQALLERTGKTPWRKVWSVSDGGSNSCEAGARHYGWAVRRIRSYGLAPDSLLPGITRQARDLAHRAATEPDLQCVGDLDGGPA
ncbi:hypothetical protein [Sphingomonas sp. TDK1]|uniref:hypothetical protein n=1 Tax=Sphingomonas sp. TDK1 TaxID=453247 RepID=UPI0007D9A9B5|nr:hypothetical protein [Sphingomonas sp. TDK1]OAN57163.1 hypothetical protein A7X12_08025 [Sphingomonas sp. TDK1]